MKTQEKLRDVINNLTPEVRNVVTQVLTAERRKLHLKRPKGIIDEIRQIIQQEDARRET